MNREIIIPKDEVEWLLLRAADITSTMVSALFDLSPYATPYEMYHAKKNGLFLPFESNERMEKGSRMQDYAAAEISLANGWEHRRMDEYIRIPELRMGSSFDYEVISPEKGAGILEIKAVDYFQFKDKWSDEAPPHIEAQLQMQLEVADIYNWGVIGVFTSIYDSHLFFRDRDHDMGGALKAMCAKFWKDVEDGNEPKPDFYRDSEVIAALYKNLTPLPVDMTENDEMDVLASKYLRQASEYNQLEKDKDATKTKIHYLMGSSGTAFTMKHMLDTNWTKDGANKKGYRKLKIKPLNKPKGDDHV